MEIARASHSTLDEMKKKKQQQQQLITISK